MKLFLCSACNRHVKDADATCPFCGSELGQLVGDSSVVAPRMSRTAIALGVAAGTAVALMMTNCSSSSDYGMADVANVPDAGADSPGD
jgi:RNA polymerase subunit RPABC4/transcription elongation factor Spt4